MQIEMTPLCTSQTSNGAKSAVDVPETSGAHAERTGKPSFPSLHARYARMNVLTRRICPYLSI